MRWGGGGCAGLGEGGREREHEKEERAANLGTLKESKRLHTAIAPPARRSGAARRGVAVHLGDAERREDGGVEGLAGGHGCDAEGEVAEEGAPEGVGFVVGHGGSCDGVGGGVGWWVGGFEGGRDCG